MIRFPDSRVFPTLADFVAVLGGELYGSPDRVITGIAPLEAANSGDLSILHSAKYQKHLCSSRAACIIVGPAMADLARSRGDCIVSEQPYVYFAKVTQLWKKWSRSSDTTVAYVHPSAVVHPSALIADSVRIGAHCVIEAGASIGPNSELKSRVTVGEGCSLGARCIVHSGVVIGADGFGFAHDGVRWEKIEQLGAVRIGDDVEIGANTCIDRGTLQDTVIEDGVKLDNLIQIGHNVHIGAHTAMAGCVGVAGSATIGPNCTVGGGAIVLGHLTVAAGVHVSAATVVSKSIHNAGNYTGIFPIDENANWERNAASLKQLHNLRNRIKNLEKENKQ